METTIFYPNAGRMPVLEKLPTLLQKPVLLLSGLSCVAGIISGLQQDDNSTMLYIDFSEREIMDYKRALDCFKIDGVKAKYLNVNFPQRFIRIKLSHTKSLLN